MVFLNWIASFFNANHPNSSRRLVAVLVFALAYVPGRVYFFLHCPIWWLHLVGSGVDAALILITFGITTFSEVGRTVSAIRNGTQITEETRVELATKTTTTETESTK